MGFLDDALDMTVDVFDRGVVAAKGAVSGVAVEQQPFMREFARVCDRGVEHGWHEGNGGNLSYRLRPEEVEQIRGFFFDPERAWIPMDVVVGNLAGQFFAITRAGSALANVSRRIEENVGIVEINASGDAWRLVWGLKDGGSPTSEMVCHLMNHSVRCRATGNKERVIYHTHSVNIIAVTKLLPNDAAVLNDKLWRMTTECILAFPEGLGLVPSLTPGSINLAQATCEWMKACCGCVWANHGLFVSGEDFDAAFGLVETIEKAADIYLTARMANGGSDEFASNMTDDQLRRIAKDLHVTLSPWFLR